ncbi:MAG: NAD-dependent epimerase/dehydratase family protein, partial [Proteobacteria bacterium]|nr:NAD-dependent epimerase/dehydratase family protein [Pseudomonadota bacterium]
MCTGKIILAGGSGFLGRTLGKWLAARDCEIVVLSRQPHVSGFARTVSWDAHSLGPWTEELEGASALINLAGRSVNCRYHAHNRREMIDSRVLSTRVLGEAVRKCDSAPPVWLNSSTATIYKHTYDDPHDEAGNLGATPEAKDAFSIEVAQAWEAEFEKAETPSTRKIILRTAMVFGDERGGVFEVLRRLTRLGLGGKMGHGRQYVSWIHAVDFCRAIEWLIDNPNAEGTYNICAPNPIPNTEMMTTFRRTFGIPIG